MSSKMPDWERVVPTGRRWLVKIIDAVHHVIRGLSKMR